MAKYSGAVWRPIRENTTQPGIRPTQVILHSAVGSGSLYDLFQYRSDLESHFWVGFSVVEQYVDTTIQADANLDANVRAISIESADNGDPDHFAWTDYQVDQIVSLLVWAHRTHGIPLRRCPAWDQPGIGYHTMWGSPSHWTPVAKTCPGAARINQFSGILARAVAQAGSGEDEDMWLANVAGPDTREFLIVGETKIHIPTPGIRNELRAKGVPDRGEVSASTLNLFRTVSPTDVPASAEAVAALQAQVAALRQAVEALQNNLNVAGG